VVRFNPGEVRSALQKFLIKTARYQLVIKIPMNKQSKPFIHTNDLRGARRLTSYVHKDNMRNAHERVIIWSLNARHGILACIRVFGNSCRNSHKKGLAPLCYAVESIVGE
jgi:hypothetical protein